MSDRDIAYEDETVAENEQLPFPRVHYPGHYGVFFAFRSDEASPLTFCSCSKEAIENYIEFRLRYSRRTNANPYRNFLLDSSDFPLAVVKSLKEKGVEQDRSLIEYLNFEDRLCHDCNDALPKYRYSHEMYATKFSQNYGWYIKKKSYEYGINSGASTGNMAPINEILYDSCPEEILDLLDDDIDEKIDRCDELRRKDEDELTAEEESELERLTETLLEQSKQIGDLIENEVRQSFGHYKKGNRWTSETILYQLIESHYPEYDLKRHYRPGFLDGLELDIFIEEEEIGIEYQGVQHYEPVEHWGGEEGLQKRQKRDKKKKQLCEENDIELVYFRHDEELSEEQVREKIEPRISDDT